MLLRVTNNVCWLQAILGAKYVIPSRQNRPISPILLATQFIGFISPCPWQEQCTVSQNLSIRGLEILC